MKKYNIWNKIFHKRELNKNIEDYKFQQSLVNSYEYWLTKIGNANTLTECMAIHKYIWRQGFNGLNILTIEEWEDRKEEPYDSTQTCYVLCAYKRLLKSNIIAQC